MRYAVTLVAAFALVVPPVPVVAQSIMVDICGAPGKRMVLPVKSPLPNKGDGHDCCKKGCHAANERKKRISGEAALLYHTKLGIPLTAIRPDLCKTGSNNA